MGEPRHVLEGASATAMDSVAQVYVFATARPRWTQYGKYGKYMMDIRNDILLHLMYKKEVSLHYKETDFEEVHFPDDCGTLFKDQIIIIHSLHKSYIFCVRMVAILENDCHVGMLGRLF